MARCGCDSPDQCQCAAEAGNANADVSGVGSTADPFSISAAPFIVDTFADIPAASAATEGRFYWTKDTHRAYFDDGTALRLLTPESGGVQPAATAPGTSSFTDMGTETIVFPDPGVPVLVIAHFTLNANSSAATATINVSSRTAISFDGGSTFTTGNEPNCDVDTDDLPDKQNLASGHFRSGTPTGDIVVKGQVRTPSAGNVAFGEAGLLAHMTGVPS